ncbi:hypothetical protein EBR77_03930 [bacterium]|nr:hypothetical protein [bacterium]NBX78521.1 hypothetical protein [bacterium]
MKKIIVFFSIVFSVQQALGGAITVGGWPSMSEDSALGVFGQFLGGQEKLDTTDAVGQLSLQEDLSIQELERSLQVDVLLRRALQASQELLEYLEWHTPKTYSEKDFSQDDVRELLSQAAYESAALAA